MNSLGSRVALRARRQIRHPIFCGSAGALLLEKVLEKTELADTCVYDPASLIERAASNRRNWFVFSMRRGIRC